jgi:hypothetical protein
MPAIRFRTVDINKAAADLNHALREGAYVAVGLGVLGFQRAQVRRVELTRQLEAQWEQLSAQWEQRNGGDPARAARTQLTGFARSLDEQLQPARKQLDERIDRLEEYLPAGTRNLVQSVRAVALTREQLLRNRVGLD